MSPQVGPSATTRLEERLRVVEDELLSRKTPGAAPEPRPQPDFGTDTVAVYEGPSSFATQSIQATEAFHKTTYSDGNVDASFRRLQDLLRPSTTFNDYRFSRNVQPQPAEQMTLLPVELILTVLRKVKANAGNMRRLFWTVYTFDRNVSLLMGRASCLQDIEIDTSHPELSANPSARPWDESFIMGIKMARLQGQIYSRLYSTAALAGDPADRAQHIRELATELHQWLSELKEIDGSQVNHPQIYQLSRKNWDILYYSSLTSTLRASSASGSESEINSDCFKAARLALHGHLDCMPAYDETGYLSSVEYANWMLASSSFTPFLVIFLHATSATSWSDLELLDQVVSSLERIRSASRACERLYQICATFARLARGLMQTHSSHFGIYTDEDDTLRFFNGVGQTSIFHPESIQGILDSETVDYLTAAEADDMTSILENWASGQPLGMDLFGFSE
ncbi:hypothetical protein N8T08_008748 [Aspergillus melleus]|uniref:Uncharacterized protein n=1 Tax=Aspergillus melleus TaxID=138277 RepID=A0ACC3BE09_9EURO|nr:hypothetical protein N8T08_008748 [Aspergillus melleus]